MRYSSKFKEKMITKALRADISVTDTAAAAGISKQTLYAWIREARIADVSSRSKKKQRGRPRKSRWTPEEKLRILGEIFALSDEDLGAFMRREGLHEADLQTMRAEALVGLTPAVVHRGPSPEQRENKKLKSELRRKEKALAEAAALLILQKKFRALMEEEGDDTAELFGDDS